MPKICLIEDEESLVELIKFNLELEGYSVNVFQNGQRAIDEIDEIIESDLVILDVMLPEVSGFDVCKSIRNHSQVPVLFLSAKGMAADRIHGLRLGANDYLPKPFDLEELILRVQNLIPSNDSTLNAAEVVVIGSKKIDFSTYEMTDSKTGNQHLFSKREIELLKLYIESKGQVISRYEIIDRIWAKENILVIFFV